MTLDKNTETVVVQADEPIRGSKARIIAELFNDHDNYGCTVSINQSRNGHLTVQCIHSESCPAHLEGH